MSKCEMDKADFKDIYTHIKVYKMKREKKMSSSHPSQVPLNYTSNTDNPG